MKDPDERRQKVEYFVTMHIVDGSETREFKDR